MKLSAYLSQHQIRPAKFAADIGVPASTISRIISGKRSPRLETAQKIANATEGAVTLKDFVSEESDHLALPAADGAEWPADVPRPEPVREDA